MHQMASGSWKLAVTRRLPHNLELFSAPGRAWAQGEGQAVATKETYTELGGEWRRKALDNYRNRANNHWGVRVELATRLVHERVLPRLGGRAPQDILLIDIGCSIGTFAIEFAKLGFRTVGMDFDPGAIETACELARSEGVEARFICGDVRDWPADLPPIDIALSFDLFEHLHDDELGVCLHSLHAKLAPDGALVFHTFPTQYDYIFYGRPRLRYPLLGLRWLKPTAFTRAVKAYAGLIDIGLLVKKGRTYAEGIELDGHCNPTTAERLEKILNRSGYEVALIETGQCYAFKAKLRKAFAGQPIADRNLYGVAFPAANYP